VSLHVFPVVLIEPLLAHFSIVNQNPVPEVKGLETLQLSIIRRRAFNKILPSKGID
jgi:hypothetical protein